MGISIKRGDENLVKLCHNDIANCNKFSLFREYNFSSSRFLTIRRRHYHRPSERRGFRQGGARYIGATSGSDGGSYQLYGLFAGKSSQVEFLLPPEYRVQSVYRVFFNSLSYLYIALSLCNLQFNISSVKMSSRQ